MKTFAIFLFASLLLSVPAARSQSGGVPVGFSYQGVILVNGNPIPDATHEIIIRLKSSSDSVLYSQSAIPIVTKDGVFNIIVGGPNGTFPSTLDFNQQYFLEVFIDGNPFTSTPIWSAPYAINAGTVNGLQASSSPVSGELFPVPLATDSYNGTAKINANFLPTIPNNKLAMQDIVTINGITPSSDGNFAINAGTGIDITPGTNGITITNSGSGGVTSIIAGPGVEANNNGGAVTVGIAPSGIVSSMLSSNLTVTGLTVLSNSQVVALTAHNSEQSGNAAFAVQGGVAAQNSTGNPDGTGLNSNSPQTYFVDNVAVPTATTTSLQIYNTLIAPTSTILITPVGISAAVGDLAITSQSIGTFTVSSTVIMGTGGGGSVTGINYEVVNH